MGRKKGGKRDRRGDLKKTKNGVITEKNLKA